MCLVSENKLNLRLYIWCFGQPCSDFIQAYIIFLIIIMYFEYFDETIYVIFLNLFLNFKYSLIIYIYKLFFLHNLLLKYQMLHQADYFWVNFYRRLPGTASLSILYRLTRPTSWFQKEISRYQYCWFKGAWSRFCLILMLTMLK